MPAGPSALSTHSSPHLQAPLLLTPPGPTQHGVVPDPDLADLPPISRQPLDILIRIWALLDPPDLAVCERVCRLWNQILNNDALWMNAFFAHFQISESSSDHLPATRLDSRSWRREYISRVKLLRTWSQSSTRTISHDPRVALVHSFHATFSPTYQATTVGLRSERTSQSSYLTGHVLKKRPFNVHFTIPFRTQMSAPTVVKMSPDGNRLAWGLSDGEVRVCSNLHTHSRKSRHSALRILPHVPPLASHAAHITVVVFAAAQNRDYLLTCCSSGIAKLWDLSSPENSPVWTGPKPVTSSSTTTSVSDHDRHPITAADIRFHSPRTSNICDICVGNSYGQVFCWANVSSSAENVITEQSSTQFQKFTSSCFCSPSYPNVTNISETTTEAASPHTRTIAQITLDRIDGDHFAYDPLSLSVLVHIQSSTFFEAFRPFTADAENVDNSAVDITGTRFLPSIKFSYIPGVIGSITRIKTAFSPRGIHHSKTQQHQQKMYSHKTFGDNVLQSAPSPVLAPNFGSCKYVVAGDADGGVYIWDWSIVAEGITSTSNQTDQRRHSKGNDEDYVSPLRVVPSIHGSVTALEITNYLLFVGTSTGVVLAYHILEPHSPLIRSFQEPRNIRQQEKRRTRRRLQDANEHLNEATATSTLGSGTLGTTDTGNLLRTAVTKIVADNNGFVASASNRLMAWIIPRENEKNHKPKKSKAHQFNGRSTNRLSAHEEMMESLQESEEVAEIERSPIEVDPLQANIKEHHGDLSFLSEAEAMEYALMLSREQEEEFQTEEMLARAEITEDDQDGYEEGEEEGFDENEFLYRAGGLNDAGPSGVSWIDSDNPKVELTPSSNALITPKTTWSSIAAAENHEGNGGKSDIYTAQGVISSQSQDSFPVLSPTKTSSQGNLHSSSSKGKETLQNITLSDPHDRSIPRSFSNENKDQKKVGTDGMDEDLRFAIELSLAEARSKGS